MPDINQIIKAIDNELTSTKKIWLGAVEANYLLEKLGLLRDSKNRKGKPLRDLLRKGLIPHAYQAKGKNSTWRIPHSSKTHLTIELESSDGEDQRHISPNPFDEKRDSINEKSEILSKIEVARLSYKPLVIKYLIVAEAPPDSLDRFFYFEDVKIHDYLFLGITQALYPELKSQYLKSNRSKLIKNQILNRFKEEGFYLIDLSNLPLGLMSSNLESQVPELLRKLDSLIDIATFIIPVKANVYNIIRQSIFEAGYEHFIDISIPFPGQGWQKEFQAKFAQALKKAGYNSTN